MPRLVISASSHPLPPRRLRITEEPSALPRPNEYTSFVIDGDLPVCPTKRSLNTTGYRAPVSIEGGVSARVGILSAITAVTTLVTSRRPTSGGSGKMKRPRVVSTRGLEDARHGPPARGIQQRFTSRMLRAG